MEKTWRLASICLPNPKTLIQKKSKTVNKFFFSFKGDKKGRVCVEATGFLWMKNKKIHLRRLNWKTPMTPRQINQKEENKTQRKMDAQNPTNVSRGVMEQCMLDYECLRPEQSGWQNPDRENLEKKITRRNTFDATDLRCFFFSSVRRRLGLNKNWKIGGKCRCKKEDFSWFGFETLRPPPLNCHSPCTVFVLRSLAMHFSRLLLKYFSARGGLS